GSAHARPPGERLQPSHAAGAGLPGHPARQVARRGRPAMRLLDSPLVRSVHGVPPTIRLDELLAAVGGRLQGPTAVTSITGASVDSRRTTPGSCYVALRGDRVDGHRFVVDALRAGAVAALVNRPVA